MLGVDDLKPTALPPYQPEEDRPRDTTTNLPYLHFNWQEAPGSRINDQGIRAIAEKIETHSKQIHTPASSLLDDVLHDDIRDRVREKFKYLRLEYNKRQHEEDSLDDGGRAISSAVSTSRRKGVSVRCLPVMLLHRTCRFRLSAFASSTQLPRHSSGSRPSTNMACALGE
jgi:hypothetical protein